MIIPSSTFFVRRRFNPGFICAMPYGLTLDAIEMDTAVCRVLLLTVSVAQMRSIATKNGKGNHSSELI